MSSRISPHRFWTASAAVLLASALLLFVVGPVVIARAYTGQGFTLLSPFLAGAEDHPLQHYLDAWSALTWPALGVEVALVLLLHLGLRHRGRVGRALDALTGGPPDVAPGIALWIAVWLGVISGMLEVWHLGIRQLIERLPASGFAWEYLWMGPVSSGLAFGIAGAGVLAVVVGMRRLFGLGSRVGLRFTTLIFAWAAAFAPLQTRGVPLATYAVVLSTLGVAVAVSRAMAARPQASLRLLRRSSLALGVVVVAGVVLGLLTLPGALERRRLAARDVVGGDGPNIVLIILDTVRAASMGLYGYPGGTTPNLDRFAQTGVTFDRAIAPSPWTLPSHASLFTGHYFHELSVDRGTPLDDVHPTLAEVLADGGYATAGFVANFFNATDMSGLERGFARWEDYPMRVERLLVSTWAGSLLFRRLLALDADPWRAGPKTAARNTDDVLRWVSTRREEPFFAFVNYMDAHAPYDAPAEYRARFPAPRPRVDAETEGATEELLAGTLAHYDAALAYVDAEVGRLIDGLEGWGLLDNTVVVVSSDHGEQFGEHGLQYHGNSLYTPAVHVPLMISYPGRVPAGVRVPAPVSIRDVAATLVDIALDGASTPLAGSSLTPHWSTSGGEGPGAPPVLTEVTATDRGPEILEWEPIARGSLRALFLSPYHYIQNGDGAPELYDLAVDPAEDRNLAASPEAAGLVRRLQAALDSVVAATGGDDPRWELPAPTLATTAGAGG